MNSVHIREEAMPKVIENLRERIIEEGRTLLLQKNYSGYNIREIARNCGIGLGTFYNYFQNKEELAGEIFRKDWEDTLLLAEELKWSEETLKSKLGRLYRSLECFIDTYLSIFHEIAVEKGTGNHCPRDNSDIYEKLEELLTVEQLKGNLKIGVEPFKLSHFILSNIFNCIKSKYMSFDELYQCMNLPSDPGKQAE
jgi:AcrR family transcriptional regulator